MAFEKMMNTAFDRLFGIKDTEKTVNESKKNGNEKKLNESIKMNESTYRGVPNTRFIWHGEWADPEIAWIEDGCEYIYNYYDIEDTLWDFFVEETGKDDDSAETEKEFNEFCKKELPYLISDLTPKETICDESLKMNEAIDWSESSYINDFRSDVYKALADIAWKYSRKISNEDIMEYFDNAYEWFSTYFANIIDESCRIPNYKKIKEMLSKVNEAPMSDEDRRENDLLRSIYSKRMNRANAKLTPDEQGVLDKYDLYTDNWKGYNGNRYSGIYKGTGADKSMIIGNSETYADTARGISDITSHGIGASKYSRIKKDSDGKTLKDQNTWHYDSSKSIMRNKSTKTPDKINYVDRARKLDDRVKPYEYQKNGTWGSYSTTDIQKPGVEGQRERINREMGSPVVDMKGAIRGRDVAQQKMDDAKSVYDKKISDADNRFNSELARATKQRDFDRDWARQSYERDSDPKERDAAQQRIDNLLKRNK